MSQAAPGPGWWQASDGKWYPPRESDAAPGPGWWLASDGKWYPPQSTDSAPGPGWWLASDGKWYPPQDRPGTSSTKRTTKPTVKPGRAAKAKAKRARTEKPPRPAHAEAPAPAIPTAPVPTSASAADVPLEDGPVLPAFERVRPINNEGLSPDEQIERRNQASRDDAVILATQRAAAASRVLGLVQAELAATVTVQPRPVEPTAAAPPAPDPVAPPPAAQLSEELFALTPEPAQPEPSAPNDGEPHPLLEVKASPLVGDPTHLGDRLAIFHDRVELRDRLDRIRQTIKGGDIADVVVQKRLKGAVLTIDSTRGPGIVAKGLRTDQADEARRLIMQKLQPARRVDESEPAPTAAPAPVPAPVAKPSIDEPALLRALTDLHEAGVLTDDEYEQKVDLLGHLAHGDDLEPSTP